MSNRYPQTRLPLYYKVNILTALCAIQGGYFFRILNFMIVTTSIANANANINASNTVIYITPFRFGMGVAAAPAYRLPCYMILVFFNRFNKR
jgi:hypothetical protein